MKGLTIETYYSIIVAIIENKKNRYQKDIELYVLIDVFVIENWFYIPRVSNNCHQNIEHK